LAVAVILIAVLSMFAVVMGFMALAPVVQELGSPSSEVWQNTTDVRALTARDSAFQSILVLPLFMILAIAAWLFLTLTRRDFGQTA